MHPVLGTMMPKICEAPHLPTSLFQPSFCPAFKEWDAFITFFPHERAAGTALRTILTFLTNIAPDMDVHCFCFSGRDALIYRRILEEHHCPFLTDDES
ncbi:hypothetical protein MU985_005018 [Salmonella enterica]|nr:hypothetical protein [Salmonella enterica subsp. diarizonae serovar 48:i:z]EGY4501453.1 hypothetical protein [Salmonella enterica]EHK4291680.1 hypothetical protein [Salmonella enterica]EHK4307319.1 hypothetical protein [Salmonella enterica]EJA5030532.1 hypothetical protein [Salmonella enterica]